MQCSKLSSPVHLPLILVQYITPSDLSALPISGKTGTARSRQDQKSGRVRLGRGYKGNGTRFEIQKGKVRARLKNGRAKLGRGLRLKRAPSSSKNSRNSNSKPRSQQDYNRARFEIEPFDWQN